jgi:hypothetical protein
VTVGYLASSESPAYWAGFLTAMFALPAAGLICLIIGLVQRSRSRRQAAAAYPPQYPTPPGYPVNTGYPYPQAPPGYPGPYPTSPYAGYQPLPRAKKSGTTLIITGVVLLVLGVLGILGQMAQVVSHPDRGSRTTGQTLPSSTAGGPEIGQCFSEFEVGIGKLNEPTDCAKPVATYELAAIVGPTAGCPDNKRDGSLYARLTNESRTLCFAANLIQGQCYLRTDEHTTSTWTPADCTQPRYAKFKVDKRIDGGTDETPCPPGDTGIAYPVPARVYCVARTA